VRAATPIAPFDLAAAKTSNGDGTKTDNNKFGSVHARTHICQSQYVTWESAYYGGKFISVLDRK